MYARRSLVSTETGSHQSGKLADFALTMSIMMLVQPREPTENPVEPNEGYGALAIFVACQLTTCHLPLRFRNVPVFR